MTRYRLTRRGKLLLHTFPLFLVMSTGVTVAVDRLSTESATARVAERAPDAAPVVTTPPARPATPRATPSATPSPKPKPTPKPTPTARPTRAPFYGTGVLAVVPGSSAVHGRGPLRRFSVEVEAGLGESPAAFAAAVERVLFDERSWGGGGRLAFQRVSSGPVAFRVVLAAPATTDRLCRPLDTGGSLSCYMNGRAILNAMRWFNGANAYAGDLASYRTYMVNHEVGHALGHGHRFYCGAGGLAPVMIQQTKGLRGCGRNPWPLAEER
ncbi:MAG TPA: DUF3152 domain-containing protein [Frankiaceae bacterium]|nr:DUF3152 domain-containing protein [Frankiaceae bacterium]